MLRIATDIYQTYQFYAFGTAGWLITQGLVISLAPQFVLKFLWDDAPAASEQTLTYTRFASIPFFAFALLVLLLPPQPPRSTFPDPDTNKSDDPKQPLPSESATPTSLPELVIPFTTVVHIGLCIFGYTHYVDGNAAGGTMSSWLYMAVSAFFAAVGMGIMLFGDESRPGRGSRWPFESAGGRKQRKEK